ncbi:MAG TPA: sigma 54-interacting transcriptional regulator [Polyangia bacterium]|nr:sigma 54-interacting transcriptional regulator [Polyangia bacterium]
MATPRPSTLVDGSRSQAGGALGYHLAIMGEAVFETVALPLRGEVIVGRGSEADVRVAEPRASRRHARLVLGDEIRVEDLGSANGTRVRGRKLEAGKPVTVAAGEAISIGALVLMVQPNRAAGARRGVLPHAELEGRIDWECARGEATGGGFSVARVVADERAVASASAGAVTNAGALRAVTNAGALRAVDVLGRCGPGELGLLLPALVGPAALKIARAFAATLEGARGDARVGVATYPQDGRNAAALLARAGERAELAAPEAWAPVTCVEGSMRRLYALAARAAAGAIGVVILGETGVGKDVLARFVHDASPRAARPFVSVNCAALSESLLESELFGHERGAFTGAGAAKEGLLETAPGGTVFLDEVGELPPATQAKLLRVVETREVLRVGGVRARKIDVRFVAATNRDLEAEVARGAFRRDLYFRLNGMTLTIPPLRERPGDLPLLARAFVKALAAGAGRRRAPALSEGALGVLAAHAWPGNVRELRNVVERALLLCDGDAITEAHLPTESFVAPSAAPAATAGALAAHTDPRHGERARILAALAACAGNQSRAARKLGISRKVLIARLDAYGVARPRKPARP